MSAPAELGRFIIRAGQAPQGEARLAARWCVAQEWFGFVAAFFLSSNLGVLFFCLEVCSAEVLCWSPLHAYVRDHIHARCGGPICCLSANKWPQGIAVRAGRFGTAA